MKEQQTRKRTNLWKALRIAQENTQPPYPEQMHHTVEQLLRSYQES